MNAWRIIYITLETFSSYVLREKQMDSPMVIKISALCSVPTLQQQAIGPCLQSDKSSSSHSHINFFITLVNTIP
jgi:hypothetical protein